MRIKIKDSDSKRGINIALPNRLSIFILRNLSISKKFRCYINMDKKDLKQLIKVMKYLNKHHKGLVLIETEESDGSIFKIVV